MNSKKTKIIACATVIEEARPFLPPSVEYYSIDAVFHNQSKKLHDKLQELINTSGEGIETIIIGYGLCSKAVIGLKSSNCTLVVPRVDDCIGLFLGSQKLYRELLKKNIGTYYLSPGWIRAGATLIEELKRVEDQYGKKNAEFVKHEMIKNYTRLAYINMGSKTEHFTQDSCREFARNAAKQLNLNYEEITGTTHLIIRMINGPWDDRFVVAPPGQEITHGDFECEEKD